MKIINKLEACCELLGTEPNNLGRPIAEYKHAIKVALDKIPDEFYLMDSCCRQGKDGCCADWYESNSAEVPASCHKCIHFDHELYEIKLKEYAEFKKTVTKMNNVITETFSNLTKAREIIRDLLSYLYSVEYDHVSDLEHAEQFLKEV